MSSRFPSVRAGSSFRVYHSRVLIITRFVTVSPGSTRFLTSLPVLPGSIKLFNTTMNVPRFIPVRPGLPRQRYGSVPVHPCLPRFMKPWRTGANRGAKPGPREQSLLHYKIRDLVVEGRNGIELWRYRGKSERTWVNRGAFMVAYKCLIQPGEPG